MLWLIFIWFTVWCAIRVIKSEPGITIAVIAGWIIALLVVFGVPHIRG